MYMSLYHVHVMFVEVRRGAMSSGTGVISGGNTVTMGANNQNQVLYKNTVLNSYL